MTSFKPLPALPALQHSLFTPHLVSPLECVRLLQHTSKEHFCENVTDPGVTFLQKMSNRGYILFYWSFYAAST